MRLALLLAIAAPALAQEADFAWPDPFREGMVEAICANWDAMRREADREAMAQAAGVWDGQGVEPGVPGLSYDTPIQTRT